MKTQFFSDHPLSIDLISNTFTAAFGIPFDKNYWLWRFQNNPQADYVYINYIIEDNKLAAYYAVSPTIIKVDGKTHRVALSNMTMTHPDFQGKGYFKMLADEMFQRLKEKGFSGVFGFANKNSHYGFRKYLNWKDLSHLNLFSLDIENFRYKFSSTDLQPDISETDVNENILRATEGMIVSNALIQPDRSPELLKWRLLDIPTQQYYVLNYKLQDEIVALLFFKYYMNCIDIVEFFCKPSNINERFDILARSISQLIEKKKCINIWSNIHNEEHLFLEKIGFNEAQFITYFGFIPFVQDERLTRYENWHYRFMDSDVF